MYCPRCGSTQEDDLRFCKACGANLYAVRQALDDARETDQKFDWTKTWVAEMFMSAREVKRRKEELDRQRGITPAVRRYQEIKAGVIVSSVGLAVAIFLLVFMEGLIRSGNISTGDAEILSHIWIVGIIPFLVGVALMINGLFVSKRLVELARQAEQIGPKELEGEPAPNLLRSADTTEFVPSSFSVTEGTTKHLRSSGQK